MSIFLSITIPSFNHGHYLETCLDSIVKQKFKHGYEIIVVDNFSIDNTRSIVSKYQKKYKNIFMYQKKLDQSQAINFGFQKSRGVFLAWQNCDDFYYSGAFNSFYKQYKKNNKSKIIYGNMDLVDIKMKKIRSIHFQDVNFFHLCAEGMVISNQSAIFHFSLFPLNNLRKFHNSFDYDFFLNLAKKKIKFYRISSNKSLAAFRIYEGQKSNHYSDQDIKIRRNIINSYKQNFLYKLKWLSKIVRMIRILNKNGFSYFINYIFQKKI